MKHFLFAAACVALFSTVACKANYDKTKSGLVYRIISSKGGAPVKGGDFVKFNVEFRMSTPKDTVLNSTYGKFPGYARVDTGAQVEYSFFEIMPKCKVGDSVEFSISVDTLEKRKMIQGFNKIFVRNGVIKGRFTILKAFEKEEMVKADYDAESEKMKSTEIASLQNYITKKGIKAVKTKSGVFVEIDQPGDPALKADIGKQVSIMYRGYLQDDNSKVFDTNMDTTKHHTDPIDVTVGQGGVIPGWEEALPYFTKGSKGKMYIPSSMGYGMRGSGEIPPNANLIFDIEIRDVKDAPVQPQGGGMGGMTPEQMQQMQQMMQQRQQMQKDSSAAPKQ